jgi:hypothetical protein
LLEQTLILAGALGAAPMRADLISYAVPSYYGMVVAVYEPAPPAAKPATTLGPHDDTCGTRSDDRE